MVQIVGIIRFKMEVVTAEHGLFTAWTDENAKMILVRTLVSGKADVAIEAVGAVFQGEVFTTVIEFLYAENELFGNLIEILLRFQVLVLMLLKPRPVVVAQ